jgi:hypothetical protein
MIFIYVLTFVIVAIGVVGVLINFKKSFYVCPLCEEERVIEFIYQDEAAYLNGRKVIFKACFLRCVKCGGEFENADTLDANMLSVLNAKSMEDGE